MKLLQRLTSSLSNVTLKFPRDDPWTAGYALRRLESKMLDVVRPRGKPSQAPAGESGPGNASRRPRQSSPRIAEGVEAPGGTQLANAPTPADEAVSNAYEQPAIPVLPGHAAEYLLDKGAKPRHLIAVGADPHGLVRSKQGLEALDDLHILPSVLLNMGVSVDDIKMLDEGVRTDAVLDAAFTFSKARRPNSGAEAVTEPGFQRGNDWNVANAEPEAAQPSGFVRLATERPLEDTQQASRFSNWSATQASVTTIDSRPSSRQPEPLPQHQPTAARLPSWSPTKSDPMMVAPLRILPRSAE